MGHQYIFTLLTLSPKSSQALRRRARAVPKGAREVFGVPTQD
jgi:hypothetical protein